MASKKNNEDQNAISVFARLSRSDPWQPATLVECKKFTKDPIVASSCGGEERELQQQQRDDPRHGTATDGMESPASKRKRRSTSNANNTNSSGSGSNNNTGGGGNASSDSFELWCYVDWKDKDKREACWIPASDVDLNGDGVGGQATDVIISNIATQKLPLNRRNEIPILSFLEERLWRDIRCPTSLRRFHFAGYVFQPWYYSPYGLIYPAFRPDSEWINDAYLCPFTLEPFSTWQQLETRTKNYGIRREKLSPPGREIYRDEEAGVSLLEVDGAEHRTFCRNLFLLCKSFLENKLAGHDVDIYVFYVLCVHGPKHCPDYVSRDDAMMFAGFYSWEKNVDEHNLACILTLPCFQGHGFGNFLIAASYEIGYKKRMIGTPERPLSDLGAVAYERYWWTTIATWLYKKIKKDWVPTVDLTNSPANNNNSSGVSPGTGSGGAESGMENSGGGGPQQLQQTGATEISVTVHELAKRVRLEDADVLETLLKRGLIHRTEKRELKVVVPVKLCEEVYLKQKNTKNVCVFVSSKLQM